MVAQLREVFAKLENLPEEKQIGLAFRIELELDTMTPEDEESIPEGCELDRILKEAIAADERGESIPMEEWLDAVEDESRVS